MCKQNVAKCKMLQNKFFKAMIKKQYQVKIHWEKMKNEKKNCMHILILYVLQHTLAKRSKPTAEASTGAMSKTRFATSVV